MGIKGGKRRGEENERVSSMEGTVDGIRMHTEETDRRAGEGVEETALTCCCVSDIKGNAVCS